MKNSISHSRAVVILFLLALVSCVSSKTTKLKKNTLASLIGQCTSFENHFTGFVLYDPANQKYIYEQNADKYFTPASNTKLLTLYTALSVLGDSLASFKYAIHGGNIYLKGMADPSFLDSSYPPNSALTFLLNRPEPIYISYDHYHDQNYGAGWPWDEYMETYQLQKSAFPLYGNMVQFKGSPGSKTYSIYPKSLIAQFYNQSNRLDSIAIITRLPASNDFQYNGQKIDSQTMNITLPLYLSADISNQLLADTLRRPVLSVWEQSMPSNLNWQTAFGQSSDTVYTRLMQDSDNFVAEELLLACSATLFDTMDTYKMIEYAKRHFMYGTPSPLNWWDGSGLSRYNLFTPRSIIYTLDLIQNKIAWDRITKIFPAGGVSGTLRNWYGGVRPYIYAKTGSLMNNHSVSGYIITNKGHRFIFSFMHANYTKSVNPIRKDMQKVFEYIRDNY